MDVKIEEKRDYFESVLKDELIDVLNLTNKDNKVMFYFSVASAHMGLINAEIEKGVSSISKVYFLLSFVINNLRLADQILNSSDIKLNKT